MRVVRSRPCEVCGRPVPWAGLGRPPTYCAGPTPTQRSECGLAWASALAFNRRRLRKVQDLSKLADKIADLDPTIADDLRKLSLIHI